MAPWLPGLREPCRADSWMALPGDTSGKTKPADLFGACGVSSLNAGRGASARGCEAEESAVLDGGAV